MKDAFERRRFVPTSFLGRVSADKDDPGYAGHAALMADGYTVLVFLNGIEQMECITADPDERMVCRMRMAGGSPVVYFGTLQTETVKGEVTIRLERKRAAGGPE